MPDALVPRLIVGTVTGLHRLLGRPDDDWTDPIGKIGKLALGCDQPWQRFSRDWEAKRLGLLASDVRLLESRNPDVFRAFRRSYRKLSFNEFFGWRHELRVAAELTSRDIPFHKQEAPDFRIKAQDSDVFIECGSANLTSSKDQEVSYKLAAVVTSKAGKPYANKSTALFVDYTNVLYTSVFGAQILRADTAETALRAAFAASPYGAIVGTALVIDADDDKFKIVGMAELAPNAPFSLISFVEQYAPAGPAQWVSFVPVFSG